ncbi:SH3 domain-containing protein [Eubacterium xylanophilum]|uniref:SH3 domain-containing protein n=1 Tax=Eubacterium xylanophilum TaxID=39497 RepID=UPI000478BFEA|nr:SH3 domain-containing protein [Eubacterium xylanophilum]
MEKSRLKKRFLACVAMFALVLGVVVTNVSTEAATKGKVTAASGLNMRSGVGTDYSVITTIPSNATVTINSKNAGTDSNGVTWYKVTYSGKTGYVSSAYISIQSSGSSNSEVDPAEPSGGSSATIYKTEVSYVKINVPVTLRGKVVPKKTAGGKDYKVGKKKVTLVKGSSAKIIGEKTVGTVKWFRVKFKYNKKYHKAYVKSTKVNMNLGNSANGQVITVKKNLNIRKKAGSKSAYYKIKKKIVKIPLSSKVKVIKAKFVGKTLWYRISFTYKNKTRKGYCKAKYIKLVKLKVTKKVKVTALTSAQFEKSMKDQGFPDSYKDSLRKLHESYPYWEFKGFKTGITWADAIKAESKLGMNLVSNGKSEAWKSKAEGAYDASTGKWIVFDGSTWVQASDAAIKYYMDPRNFLTIQSVFQFELLGYQPQYQTADGIAKVIQNTPFGGKSFSYTDSNGSNKTITYAQAFVEAAKESGVSPYHLASRVKQEVVTSATTTSIAVTGTNSTYPGIFNFYNIGATSGSNPALNGLKWASQGSTYMRPWNNRYKSLVGGATYIGNNYINKGQNTGYLQKFNVTSTNRYSHQYMTNLEAANSEALKTKNAYAGNLDKAPLVFSIPIYENMPSNPCAAPQ